MNRKATPIFYEGLKILRISDLPYNQSGLFSDWISTSDYLSIDNDPDCVSYDDYEYWYLNHFFTQKELDNQI